MAEMCEAAGADVIRLAEALGYDERIGRKFLGPGLGLDAGLWRAAGWSVHVLGRP